MDIGALYAEAFAALRARAALSAGFVAASFGLSLAALLLGGSAPGLGALISVLRAVIYGLFAFALQRAILGNAGPMQPVKFVWHGFLLAVAPLVLFLFVFLIGFQILGIEVGPQGQVGSGVLVAAVLGYTFVWYLWLSRFGLVLPAVAMGERAFWGVSARRTAGQRGLILGELVAGAGLVTVAAILALELTGLGTIGTDGNAAVRSLSARSAAQDFVNVVVGLASVALMAAALARGHRRAPALTG